MPHTSYAQSRESRLPLILPRSAWGADESWGIRNGGEETTVETVEHLSKTPVLTEKQKECIKIAEEHPEDFRVAPIIVREDEYKQNLKWPRRYSPAIKNIIIHHTGETETRDKDERSGTERVQAIYRAHTLSNGWGDIGYHYLIDESGIIYEGRAGGDRVIGAHAYCANVGTIGVALIGNFQRRYPSEDQMKALRSLLIWLTDRYGLDPVSRISYKGELMPVITGHRDHGDTQCPGRYVEGLLPAIRGLVASRDVTSSLIPVARTAAKSAKDRTGILQGLRPVGSIRIPLPPGGAARIRMRYDAAEQSVTKGERIAAVTRGHSAIMLWQHDGSLRRRSAHFVTAQNIIARGNSAYIDLTVLAPKETGSFSLQIGGVDYILEVQGRRRR